MKNFYHIQLGLISQLLYIYLILTEVICFILCCLDFTLLYILSLGTYIRFNQLANNPPRRPVLILMLPLQLAASIVGVLYKLALIILPSYFFSIYTENSLIMCILGTGFINITIYLSILLSFTTVIRYLPHFYRFQPHRILDVAVGAYLLLKESFNAAKFVIFNILALGTFRKNLIASYKGILSSSGSMLLKYGVLGDLLFTLVTILWIFWPIAVSYLLSNWISLILTLPITCYLLTAGYRIAQQVGSN